MQKTLRRARAPLLLLVLLGWLAGCATLAKTPASPESAPPDKAEQVSQAIKAGDAALRRGDHERALFEYVRALNADAKNETVLERIGALHAAAGKTELSKATWRHLLSLNDRNATAWEGMGLVLLREARYQEAEQDLQRALELNAALWRAQNGLGLIEDMKGNPEAAAQRYEAALALQPELPMLLNNIGYSKYLAGDMQAAESYFQKALARDARNPRALSNIALVAARRGDYDQALDSLRQLGDEAQAYNDLGYICLLDNRLDDAERMFRKAIALSPSYNVRAERNLAQLQERRRAN